MLEPNNTLKELINPSVIDRFWKAVDIRNEHECWEWKKMRNDAGYGLMRIGSAKDGSRKIERAHRISYVIHNGVINNGMYIMHSCDNPSCVNPFHLKEGTPRQNTQDSINKGRFKHFPHRKGKENSNGKLTENTVMRMRLCAGYIPYSFWVKLTCISKSGIVHAIKGSSWSHIKSIKQALA